MQIHKRTLCVLALSLPLLGLSAALALSSKRTPKPATDLQALPELAIGDWIFRSGTSADSLVIRQLSGSQHSHIGMIVRTSPSVEIIHATTDDDPTRLNQVLLSSLAEFVHPTLATQFSIARPTFLTATEKTQIAEHLIRQQGAEFLIQKQGQPHRYCTTLLAEAIQLSKPDFSPNWQQVNVAFYRGQYLFPNAFAQYTELDWIYQSPAQ